MQRKEGATSILESTESIFVGAKRFCHRALHFQQSYSMLLLSMGSRQVSGSVSSCPLKCQILRMTRVASFFSSLFSPGANE